MRRLRPMHNCASAVRADVDRSVHLALLLAGLGRRSDAVVLLTPGRRSSRAKSRVGSHRRSVADTGNPRTRVGGISADERCRHRHTSSHSDGRDSHPRKNPESVFIEFSRHRMNGGEVRPKLRKHDFFPELPMNHRSACPHRARHHVIPSGQEMGGR